jgi:hypothetical protein
MRAAGIIILALSWPSLSSQGFIAAVGVDRP